MLKNTSSLIAAFNIFAVNTFTILIANNTGLKALAILFQAFTFFAVASFQMSLLLTIFWKNVRIGYSVWIWSLLLSLGLVISMLIRNGVIVIELLAVRCGLWRLPNLCIIWSLLAWIILWLISGSIQIVVFQLICSDFSPESLRVPLQYIGNCFSSFLLILIIVLAVWAMTIISTIFAPSKALAIKF